MKIRFDEKNAKVWLDTRIGEELADEETGNYICQQLIAIIYGWA